MHQGKQQVVTPLGVLKKHSGKCLFEVVVYQIRGNKLIKRSYLLQGRNRCFCYFVHPRTCCTCCAAHRLVANWMSCLQCPGEGVCNGSVQPESGHPCLQGAPEGLPCADQGECPEEMETGEDVMNKNDVVKLTVASRLKEMTVCCLSFINRCAWWSAFKVKLHSRASLI